MMAATAIALIALSSLENAYAATPSEDAIILSPFEVRTEKDVGFVAASSLSGGRLAGDLKDTPVAYTVLTRDFLDALQLNDLQAMAEWMPSSSTTPDNGTRTVFGTSNSLPTYRGGQTGGSQRNFFPFSYNFDGYNIERLDLGRGANSVLFGNGGYGGTPNSMTKRAIVGRTAHEMRLTGGSWDNYRATIDSNVALIPGQLAVRVNSLLSDRTGWRDREWERAKGITLSATWVTHRNNEVRAELEWGERRANVVVSAMQDRLSGWDGKSTFSTQIAANVSGATLNPLGISRAGTMYVWTQASGTDNLLNWERMAVTQAGGANNQVPLNGVLIPNPSINSSSASMLFALSLPANRFDTVAANSNFKLPSRRTTSSPDGPLREDWYKVFTLSDTLRITDNLFVDGSVNYMWKEMRSNFIANRGIADIYLDVNRNLPTGAPNPNFLYPYSEGVMNWAGGADTAYNGRLSLGYVKNFKRVGILKTNVTGGYSQVKSGGPGYDYAVALDPDSRNWPSQQQVRFRYYFSDAERPMPTAGRTVNVINPIAGTTTNARADWFLTGGGWSEQVFRYLASAASAKLLKGHLDVLGAFRFDRYESTRDNILARMDNPVGWDAKTMYFKPRAPSDYYNMTYVVKDAAGVTSGLPLAAITRPRAGTGIALPQYVNDRFQDDYSPPVVSGTARTYTTGAVVHVTPWLSAFANFGQTYDVPPTSVVNITGGLLPSSEAKGWDYGLRFTLLQNAISVNLIRYTGENLSFGGTGLGNAINAVVNARPIGATVAGNQRGLQPIYFNYFDKSTSESEGWEAEIVANVTKSWRLLFNTGIPRRYSTGQWPETKKYLADNDTILRRILTDAGVTVDANQQASVNPAASSTDATSAATNWNTIQSSMSGATTNARQIGGRVTLYSANLYTDYSVRAGKLKGLRIGGGVNMRGRQVIGYRGADTIRDPANPAVAIDDPYVDALNPVYQKSYYLGTMTFGYSHRLGKKLTVDWSLKVDNLFDYAQPLYYSTALRPIDGNLQSPARQATPNAFGYVAPRNFVLTSTVKF